MIEIVRGTLRRHGLLPAYTFLMVAARSKRELRRLHDNLLPLNCQLLRKDYQIFERIWSETLWGKTPPEGGQTPDDAQLRDFLSELLRNSSLGEYYSDQLGQKSKLIGLAVEGWLPRIENPESVRNSNFEKSLMISACDTEFVIECFLSEKGQFQVILRLDKEALTEPLTHMLLTDFPDFYEISCRMLVGLGARASIQLAWMVESSKLLEMQEVAGCCSKKRVAKNGFYQQLVEELKLLGLPLQSVRFEHTQRVRSVILTD